MRNKNDLFTQKVIKKLEKLLSESQSLITVVDSQKKLAR